MSETVKACECVFPVNPFWIGTWARPTANCPLHRTLSERWDAIKSWRDFYGALKVDSPEMESFEEWADKNGLAKD